MHFMHARFMTCVPGQIGLGAFDPANYEGVSFPEYRRLAIREDILAMKRELHVRNMTEDDAAWLRQRIDELEEALAG